VLTLACGEKGDDDPPATGASGGSGGDTSAGGSSTSGGSGGTSATGGTTSSTEGSAGSAGAPPKPELAFGFDEDVEDWDVLYSSSGADAALIDIGEVEVEWAEDAGDPGGALRVSIPYESASQYVGFGVAFAESSTLDLTGRTIVAQVKIESGVGEVQDLESAPANAKVYAKSGETYVYANGIIENLSGDGDWVEVSLELGDPTFVDEMNGTFDPSDIREIGIQFDTNGESSTAQPGVLLIDNVAY